MLTAAVQLRASGTLGRNRGFHRDKRQQNSGQVTGWVIQRPVGAEGQHHESGCSRGDRMVLARLQEGRAGSLACLLGHCQNSPMPRLDGSPRAML